MDLFIPTCARDLPQVRLLLRSLDTFVDRRAVTSLTLACIDRPEIFAEVRRLATHKFQACTEYVRPGSLGLRETAGGGGQGWKLQQAAKLAFARQARTEYFMVLDSKNIAVRPVGTEDLIDRGRASWVLEPVRRHPAWWRGSTWALDHGDFDRSPDRLAISSATPVIFHAPTVVAMVAWLERRHGQSLQRFFEQRRLIRDRFMRATEFTLYYAYLDRERLGDRYHVASDRLHDRESQIWASFNPELRAERLRRILSGACEGLFTGIAFAAWEALPESSRAALHAVAAGASPATAL